MKSIAIIPARYSSNRFPGKPLVEVGGLPMVVFVWHNILTSKLLNRVLVATDDIRIAEVLTKYDVPFVLTPKEIPTGTDRIYEAYKRLNEKFEIIVNVQGDEPLLLGSDIDYLLENFDINTYDVASFVTKINDNEELSNPNNVKVVLGCNNQAIYFSRSAVPYLRDVEFNKWLSYCDFWKHIGIYAYKEQALEFFIKTEQSNLELMEKLEQLRLLEHGFKFQCIQLNKKLIGVDTPEDLEKVKIMLNNHKEL
jgi:3-deoxy-manno-octulosonate cytidylyltransferase (CMP-KDO synthetase)